MQQRVAFERGYGGAGECHPFSIPFALLRFPFANNPGIDADTGVVQEDMPVNFAHVDVRDAPGHNRGDRTFQLQRDLQVFCEMIERAERQYPQRSPGADQRASNRVHSAVAPGRDNRTAPVLDSVAGQGGKFAAVPGEQDAGFRPMPGKQLRELLLGFDRPLRPCRAIENAESPLRLGSAVPPQFREFLLSSGNEAIASPMGHNQVIISRAIRSSRVQTVCILSGGGIPSRSPV